jgi:hypothetical protein
MLRGHPIVDIRGLIEHRYEQLSPGLLTAALGAGTELHPLAMSVSTGAALDLHSAITDPASLARAALRSRSWPANP